MAKGTRKSRKSKRSSKGRRKSQSSRRRKTVSPPPPPEKSLFSAGNIAKGVAGLGGLAALGVLAKNVLGQGTPLSQQPVQEEVAVPAVVSTPKLQTINEIVSEMTNMPDDDLFTKIGLDSHLFLMTPEQEKEYIQLIKKRLGDKRREFIARDSKNISDEETKQIFKQCPPEQKEKFLNACGGVAGVELSCDHRTGIWMCTNEAGRRRIVEQLRQQVAANKFKDQHDEEIKRFIDFLSVDIINDVISRVEQRDSSN